MKLSLLVLAGLLLAPASALAGTKTYAVGPFERIHVAAGIVLDAKVGPARSVVAENADDNFDDLVIEVDGGVLEVGRPMSGWLWRRHPRYHVHVTLPELHGLHASSSASATVDGAITGNADVVASSSGRAEVSEVRGAPVGLHASSSGSVEVHALDAGPVDAHASSSGYVSVEGLDASSVVIEASSSGGVEAAGRCDSLIVSASSSGRVLAGDLHCADVQAHASSGGGIEAFASKSVSGDASSGGHVVVEGKPPQAQTSSSSGGTFAVR